VKKFKSLDLVADVARTSRRLLGILWHEDKRTFIESTIAVLIPGIVPFVNAYIYAKIINFVIYVVAGHHQSYGHLYLLILIRVVMLFIQDAAFTAQQRHNVVFSTKIPLIFSQRVMDKLSQLDMSLLEDSDFQNKFQSAKESAAYRPTNMLNNIFYSLQSVVQLLVAAISLFFLNWIFAVVLLLTAIPTFMYQAKSAKNIWAIWATNSPYRKRYNYLYYYLQDPRTVKELKLFRLSNYFVEQAKTIGKKFAEENVTALNRRFLMGTLANLVNVAGYAAVEVYIILTTLARRISIGSLTYYTTALVNYQSGINGLFRTATQVFDESRYIQDVFEVLDIEPKLVSPPNAVKLKDDKVPLIEFRNVVFSYPGAKTKILDNFSITIKPGEKVAFVGENGAGKTTIVKLLCRFYDVGSGEILINGINLKQLDLVSWYEHIGVLFQDFLKYEYTLRENIWFGQVNKPEIMEAIHDAAAQSGADSVQKSLEKGYEQMLGTAFNESIDLSTGQWQKVALARGFYRNAPILILDEPTAAIDAKAEHEIFRRVEKLTRDKTALIISHRFSTVRNADKIYVIENGKVIESGSHQKLMKLRGIYADLFNLQAEAYR
jgi:ATP-binding cassette, subfamily B, bacterial